MMQRSRNWSLVLLICILAIVIPNGVITLKLAADMDKVQSAQPQRARGLPCEAIPIRFALDEPDCANKLLRAMNVTNVNFLPRQSTESMSKNETDSHSENRSSQSELSGHLSQCLRGGVISCSGIWPTDPANVSQRSPSVRAAGAWRAVPLEPCPAVLGSITIIVVVNRSAGRNQRALQDRGVAPNRYGEGPVADMALLIGHLSVKTNEIFDVVWFSTSHSFRRAIINVSPLVTAS